MVLNDKIILFIISFLIIFALYTNSILIIDLKKY